MKTKQLVTHLAAAAFCCALGSSALSAATTTPVGAVSKTLPAGLNVISPEFVKPVEWQGASSSMTTDTISVPGTDFSSYTPGDYFIEIKSGPMEGLVANITASSNGQITVDESLDSLNGDETFCIREHTRMQDILSSADLGGSGESAVIYFDDAGNEIQLINTADGDLQDPVSGDVLNPVVEMGDGFALFLTNPTDLTTVGSVKTGKSLIPVNGGFISNIVGTLNPVSDTTLAASNLAASMTPNQDVVIFLNTDGSTTQAIYNGTNFVDTIDSSILDSASIDSGSGAFVAFGSDAYIDLPVVYSD